MLEFGDWDGDLRTMKYSLELFQWGHPWMGLG
jgi:hypothetical protein